nr:DUF3309 domain-containing protein [Chromobacterium sphagni]
MLELWQSGALPRGSSGPPAHCQENEMSLGTILLVVMIILLIGLFPRWPHSRDWGYGPSGGVGLILLILIVLILLGRL